MALGSHGVAARRICPFGLSILIALLFLDCGQCFAQSPSFDCSAAEAPDERAICSSHRLSDLDILVDRGYRYVRTRYGPSKANRIARSFLESRSACDADADCIERNEVDAIHQYQSLGAPISLSTNPDTRAEAPHSPYIVDGLALDGHVHFGTPEYEKYKCGPSEQYPAFTWCHKEKIEKTRQGEVTTSNSILHYADGRAVYINRYIEPAFFHPSEVQEEIDRLSAKFGKPARELRMPERKGLPNAVIAVWGKLRLDQLDPSDASIVAAGDSPHKGYLVGFLGDIQRSAKLGTPIYRLVGGPGFLWTASFNSEGRGVLRFLTIDPSEIEPATVAITPTQPIPSTPIPNRGLPGEVPAALPPDVPATTPTAPEPRPQDDPYVTDCDAYAASNSDPQRKGVGVPFDKIDPAIAIPACQTALASYPNSVRFQYQLARAFERRGDFEQAAVWYRKAADRGNALAEDRLGTLYAEGHGVPQDKSQAKQWYQKAADQGNQDATKHLKELQ